MVRLEEKVLGPFFSEQSSFGRPNFYSLVRKRFRFRSIGRSMH